MSWRPGQPCRIRMPLSGAASDGMVDTRRLSLDSLGPRAQEPESGLLAFPYLWRRFGPPRRGCDPYKDIAGWLLRTPDPEVFLAVAPSASALSYNVGYLAAPAVHDEFSAPSRAWADAYRSWCVSTICAERGLDPVQDYPADVVASVADELDRWMWDAEMLDRAADELGPNPHFTETHPSDWRNGPPVMRRVNEALRRALEDLLRPVWVRDIKINIFGRDATAFRGRVAPVSLDAGYGTRSCRGGR